MSNKAYKRAGLFSSTLIVIGSIIGIGIFIKNSTVFSINNGNSWAILVAWIVGAVIAILKGYSFLEVSSVKSKGNEKGLTLWMSKLVSKNAKSLTNMFLIILYLGVLVPIIAGYSMNFFMMFLNKPLEKKYLYTAMCVAPVFFTTVMLASSKLPEKLNVVMTIIKFLPLTLVALVGLFYIKNGGGIGHTLLTTATPQNRNLTIGILISLPSILFSFDAFLNVANINKNDDDGTVSKSIVIGMIVVAILYIFITISQINLNRGYVSTIYDQGYDKFGHGTFASKYELTGNMAYEGLIENVMGNTVNRIFIFIVSISGFGVVNVIIMAGSSLTSTLFKKKTPSYLPVLLFLAVTLIITGSLIGFENYEIKHRSTFSSIDYMNNDVFDNVSNMPIIFAFAFYSIILIGALRNRFTNKVKVEKKKGFIVTAIISIVMTMTVVITYFVYAIVYQSIIDIEANRVLLHVFVAYSIVATILFVGGYIFDKLQNKKERA